MNIIRLDNKFYESADDFNRLMSEARIRDLVQKLVNKNPNIINNETIKTTDIIIGCADPYQPVIVIIKDKYRFELEILGWEVLNFGFECIWEEGKFEDLKKIIKQVQSGEIKIEE